MSESVVLAQGQHVTLIRVDDMMGLTHAYRFDVRQPMDPTAVAGGCGDTRIRVGAVRQQGRRKDIFLDLGPNDIILNGWYMPFKTNTEAGGVMHGNACVSLVGDPDEIRKHIEKNALRPICEAVRAEMLVYQPGFGINDEGQLLYPDARTTHRVINDLKEKPAVSPA